MYENSRTQRKKLEKTNYRYSISDSNLNYSDRIKIGCNDKASKAADISIFTICA